MVNLKEVWMVKPGRTLCTESLGFELCVQLSAAPGCFRFIVRSRPDRPGGLSCMLVADERPSVMEAMVAAERAAAALAGRQPGRAAPQQPCAAPARGAAHGCLAPVGAPGGPEQKPSGGESAVHRLVTLHEVRALSEAVGARTVLALVAPFERPSAWRSIWQLGSTLLAYVALEATMYASLGVSYWLTLAFAVPTAGMTVRLFIFQQDCGHRSFFRSQWANVAVGRLCSPLTYTPFACWRRQHAQHHASFNNLDRRDTGLDIYSNCATVTEYQALPAARRLLYRASRHPLVTLLVLPPVAFLLLYPVPFDSPSGWRQERRSVWWTNVGLACLIGALVAAFGLRAAAAVQLPVALLGSVAGAWLFSVQHRFEESRWERKEGWSQMQASLEGSSYLRLPAVLQWFTGNIGFHVTVRRGPQLAYCELSGRLSRPG